MTFEIRFDKNGKEYLKKVDRPRYIDVEGRGRWVDIGKATDHGIESIIQQNKANGYKVVIDEFNVYRMLVLTD